MYGSMRGLLSPNFATLHGLLARFGEMGRFGGLARLSWLLESTENRAVPEGQFLHFPC
jgi:hypothetical protein